MPKLTFWYYLKNFNHRNIYTNFNKFTGILNFPFFLRAKTLNTKSMRKNTLIINFNVGKWI